MALSQSELERVKYELGYNVLEIGALPYVGYVALFDSVLLPYLNAGATTTCSTSVVTSTTGPTPVQLTLGSATGFSVFSRAVVDVDARQEIATISNVSGNIITVQLVLAHSGTYPVTVEGGETMIRLALKRCVAVADKLLTALSMAGLKRAEEVEWYQSGVQGAGVLDSLRAEQMRLRDELASLVGIQNLWRVRAGQGQRAALY